MSTILYIDTVDNKKTIVVLEIAGKKHVSEHENDKRKAQVVLPMVEELLKKQKVAFSDLTEITVNPGPGSFVGVRVGVTIANALGFVLKIPVNGKEIGESVEPIYS